MYNQLKLFSKELSMSKQKTVQEIRFEKEARALQKNIAKRKKQQQELDKKKQQKSGEN